MVVVVVEVEEVREQFPFPRRMVDDDPPAFSSSFRIMFFSLIP